MLTKSTLDLAQEVIEKLTALEQTIVTAESCTGGLIAAALTSVPGSSSVVYGGFVTYANEAKMTMIDVPASILHAHGAVSEQVAWFMADGARSVALTDVSIAVTGIAGPGGGTAQKPVGLVHLACAITGQTGFDISQREIHFGDIGRDEVRAATLNAALKLVLSVISAQE